MNIKDFKVGDTVICDVSFYSCPQKGWKGKVIDVFHYSKPFHTTETGISVKWEEIFSLGHDCGGLGEFGYCRNYFNYSMENLSLINSDNINILSLKKPAQLELFLNEYTRF
jgi:hypothetical protein